MKSNKNICLVTIIISVLWFIIDYAFREYISAGFWCVAGILSVVLYINEKSKEDFWKHKGKKY